MSYRYEWVWDWHAWQRLTKITASKLVAKIEEKIREKLKAQTQITNIESITTSDVKEWHEYVGIIYHSHVSGTTKTVFLSTVPPQTGSPVLIAAPAVVALIKICLPLIIVAVIAFFVAFSLVTAKSIVDALGAGAPILAAGAGIFLILIAVIWLMPKAVPAVKKAVKEVRKK